jgi:iron complex transport system permease protein
MADHHAALSVPGATPAAGPAWSDDRRATTAFALLAVVAVGAAAAALLSGSAALSPGEVWRALWHDDAGPARTIVWELRLPRILLAFGCGALLAVAGVLLQALLSNPLADPYVLGLSGGSASAALVAMLAGAGAWSVGAAALGGAAATSLAVLLLSYRLAGFSMERLLLAGVAMSSGLGALLSVLLLLAPAAAIHGMLFWLMGDLSEGGDPRAIFGVLAGVLACALALGARMDILALGELKARALGVAVAPVRLAMYLAAAVATAAVVTCAGTIGFVGLVVPHLLRLIGIRRHVRLLPAAALGGGAFLVVADTVARCAAAPVQLPVGACTALIGVPLLLHLLWRRRRI